MDILTTVFMFLAILIWKAMPLILGVVSFFLVFKFLRKRGYLNGDSWLD